MGSILSNGEVLSRMGLSFAIKMSWGSYRSPLAFMLGSEDHILEGEMGSYDAITDVPGIRVGHVTDAQALTGCTVLLCERGAVVGVDQRGGAPGTRETDLARPLHLVQKAHAVVLSGGSAFGLDAASGVVRYLEERGGGLRYRRGSSAYRARCHSVRPGYGRSHRSS